ncbi:hypothetical protein BGW80DRAFT_1304457 [Lactifluus volemus]|nr:hypothetical protein BGW80DRAFT_1304457 [Lactifluus volemus]
MSLPLLMTLPIVLYDASTPFFAARAATYDELLSSFFPPCSEISSWSFSSFHHILRGPRHLAHFRSRLLDPQRHQRDMAEFSFPQCLFLYYSPWLRSL